MTIIATNDDGFLFRELFLAPEAKTLVEELGALDTKVLDQSGLQVLGELLSDKSVLLSVGLLRVCEWGGPVNDQIMDQKKLIADHFGDLGATHELDPGATGFDNRNVVQNQVAVPNLGIRALLAIAVG